VKDDTPVIPEVLNVDSSGGAVKIIIAFRPRGEKKTARVSENRLYEDMAVEFFIIDRIKLIVLGDGGGQRINGSISGIIPTAITIIKHVGGFIFWCGDDGQRVAIANDFVREDGSGSAIIINTVR
jgi:hypothetical protein